ncbi:MAG: hypothetical protein IPL06_09735 [Betaproteobacteria bacterium]|nr:hypothetical protein [Betaproteobacteria bacterium]
MRRHIALLALGLAAAVPLSAAAGPHVGVSVNVPGLSIQVGNPGWGVAIGTPYYGQPAPVYYEPAPAYRPAPVYYGRPVYYAPPVRYVTPRPVVVVPRYGYGNGPGRGHGYGHDRHGDSRHWR